MKKTFLKLLKKGVVFVMGVVLGTTAFGGFMSDKDPKEVKAENIQSIEIPYGEIGEFLAGTSSAMSESVKGSSASVYNNSGMNGGDGFTQKHTNVTTNLKKTMWATQNGASISDAALTIKLDKLNQLGRMFVWNYNKTSNLTDGMRKVTVEYSVDGETYYVLGEYEFAKASGVKTKATCTTDGKVIDFGGVVAQYVKITPKQEDGNWGGKAYGLSEVKIYEFKVLPANGAYIKAEPWHPSGASRIASQYVLTNGAGLSDPKSSLATHDNNADNMWLGSTNALNFNLKGSYHLSDMYIWNYNDSLALDNGICEIEVYYTTNAADEFNMWNKLGSFTVEKAKGRENEPASVKIPFENLTAQFVRIEIKSNYGGENNGISKIRFYCGEGDYVEPAPEWSSVLGTYDGFCGADGIFSTNLSGLEYRTSLSSRGTDNRTFFLFSDTDYIQTESALDEVKRTATSFGFSNNTYAVFTGNDAFDGEMVYYYDNASAASKNVPIKPSENGAWYWLGDCAVLNGKIYFSPHLVEKSSEGIGFVHTRNDFASFGLTASGGVDFDNLTYYKDLNKNKLCYFQNVHPTKDRFILMNAGFYVNTEEAGAPNPDGYVYNYGVNENRTAGERKRLVVSRIKAEDIEDLTKYEYWNGTSWTNEITDMVGLADDISPELSLTPVTFGEHKGEYILTYQYYSSSRLTAIRYASTPWGTFSEQKVVYYTDETDKMAERLQENNPKSNGYSCFAYNAKMHPALSKENELIISYNINITSDNNNHKDNIDTYHPRFLRYSTTLSSSVDNSGIATSGQGDKQEGGNNEKGCGSVAGIGCIATALGVIGTGAIVRKKKEN